MMKKEVVFKKRRKIEISQYKDNRTIYWPISRRRKFNNTFSIKIQVDFELIVLLNNFTFKYHLINLCIYIFYYKCK